MTFQQLTYVVEISKCGSINKAAHKLFLSQSGISTAVRELEEELGLKLRGFHNDHAEGTGGSADGWGDNIGRAHADEGGDDGSHQNVDLRFFADGLAALRSDDRHKQHGQGAARAAQQVAGVAHSRQREQHQRRRL